MSMAPIPGSSEFWAADSLSIAREDFSRHRNISFTSRLWKTQGEWIRSPSLGDCPTLRAGCWHRAKSVPRSPSRLDDPPRQAFCGYLRENQFSERLVLIKCAMSLFDILFLPFELLDVIETFQSGLDGFRG